MSWPRPYKRMPLYLALAFAGGVVTHAYMPASITRRAPPLPAVHPVGTCHDELSLRLRQSLLLRPDTWTGDGYRIEGHGLSMWVANGAESLNTNQSGDASPGTVGEDSTIPAECATVLYSAVKRWQRDEIARKLDAD